MPRMVVTGPVKEDGHNVAVALNVHDLACMSMFYLSV